MTSATTTPLVPARAGASLAALLALAAAGFAGLVERPGSVASAVVAGLASALAAGWLARRLATVAVVGGPVRAAAAAAVALIAAATAAVGSGAAALSAGDGVLAALSSTGAALVLGLLVTTPAATALLVPGARARVAGTRPVPAARGTTRRGFLQAGAGSVASAAVAGAAARGLVPDEAAAVARPFRLKITEGDITMVDGSPVFFRGFTTPDGTVPQLPGPPLGNPGPLPANPEITEGEPVRVHITNDTPRDHTFLIDRAGDEGATDPVVGPVRIPANTTTPVEISFTAPAAGTYIYRDADRNNRLLGMHGVMVVLPRAAGQNRPYAPGPDRLEIPAEVVLQFVWCVHGVDPVLGELARERFRDSVIDYPLESFLPRYFFINGKNGTEALHDESTVPVLPMQDATAAQVGCLIRCVNTGVATHALHWHGNHVFVLQRNAVPARPGLVFEKDVLRLDALQRIDVLLPAHTGLDAWPMLTPDHPKFADQVFPMHCHSEMSQTAGGGLYPMGMLTDWHLAGGSVPASGSVPVNGSTPAVEQVRTRLAEQRAAIRRSRSARGRRMRLSVSPSPAPARAGRTTRFRFRTTTVMGGRRRAVRGARIRFGGRTVRTDRTGRAAVRVRFARAGRVRARVTRSGYRTLTRIVRIGRGR